MLGSHIYTIVYTIHKIYHLTKNMLFGMLDFWKHTFTQK